MITQRPAQVAVALFHIGGLSGSAVLLAEQRALEAFEIALVATACVLILTGGLSLAEIGRVKVRQYVRKHEEPHSPDPPEKGTDA
ncbi:MAG: hypothetical protein LC795_07620 [Acidobacteria bacterium]|nr:hypothetical protein [Acidobacteriota bacterium]